jgi:hypothetical protein
MRLAISVCGERGGVRLRMRSILEAIIRAVLSSLSFDENDEQWVDLNNDNDVALAHLLTCFCSISSEQFDELLLSLSSSVVAKELDLLLPLPPFKLSNEGPQLVSLMLNASKFSEGISNKVKLLEKMRSNVQ